MFRVPVLTYHSLHAPGNDYLSNDHIALEDDLALIRSLGFTIIPLGFIVKCLLDGITTNLKGRRLLALSFDDGSDHDYIDFVYPGIPTLKSFYTLLLEHRALINYGQAQLLNATSFVIASPEARTVLDHSCIAGRDQWRDVWWKEAHDSKVLDIANHSWDHCHPSLERVALRNQDKGSFYGVDNYEDANQQILAAELFISEKLMGQTTGLFAYPFGEWNNFLVHEYFPKNTDTFTAAFTTDGDYITADSNRWCLPRFVCGEHWRSTTELADLLRESVERQ